MSAVAAPRALSQRGPALIVRSLELLVFVGLPFACAGLFGYVLVKSPALFDFQTFWQSGRDVLHGRSPYPASLPAHATTAGFRPFVYPASAAALMVPLALLPWALAEAIWIVLSVAAVFGTLRVLGVRDWRVYGVVFVWPPVWSAIGNGTATLLLVFICAVLWRARSRPYVAGALVALLVVFKLYLWPLTVWLLATRRVRAATASFMSTAVLLLTGWVLIGFAGFSEYPHLLSRLTSLVADESYSPYSLVRSLGAGVEAARLSALFLGAVVLIPAFLVAHRRRGDALAFVFAIASSLVFSPIVWPHYFALLIVVVALASPRLDLGWIVPIFAWAVSTAWSGESTAKIAVCLVLYGVTTAWAIRRVAAPDPRMLVAPSLPQPAIK